MLTPLDVADEVSLTDRLKSFQDHYQEVAKPFTWKCTADDLKKRLDALKEFGTALPQKLMETSSSSLPFLTTYMMPESLLSSR